MRDPPGRGEVRAWMSVCVVGVRGEAVVGIVLGWVLVVEERNTERERETEKEGKKELPIGRRSSS